MAGPVAWCFCYPYSLPQALAPCLVSATPSPELLFSAVCTPLGGQTPAAAVGHRAGSGAQGTDYLHGSEGLVRLLADPRET